MLSDLWRVRCYGEKSESYWRGVRAGIYIWADDPPMVATIASCRSDPILCASQEALCAKRLQEAMPVSVIRNRGYGERLESRLYVSLTTGG